MDPISAIGLAAGIVQFVDIGGKALLSTIRLLKDLKHAPKMMTELLQDAEISLQRLHTLRDTIRQPSSTVFAQLSTIQNQRLLTRIDETRAAVSELQKALDPLLGTHTVGQGRVRKAWKAVISITMENAIKEKLSRISRMEKELAGNLELTNLEIQADLRYSPPFHATRISIADRAPEPYQVNH